jgi:hypothetical protein
MNKPTSIRQIRLERRSSSYWRVTFDFPPLNIFGPLELGFHKPGDVETRLGHCVGQLANQYTTTGAT